MLTTHVLADVADLADTITVLAAGRIAMQGTLAELTGSNDAVSFGGPAGLDLHALAHSLPVGYSVEQTQPGRYVVKGMPTPQVMAAITTWCAAQGVMATNLGVGNRTLEQLLIDTSSEAGQ